MNLDILTAKIEPIIDQPYPSEAYKAACKSPEQVTTLETAEYPLRYVAFENRGKAIIAKNPQMRGGYEWLVFCGNGNYTVNSAMSPTVYIEICSYQDKDFVLDKHVNGKRATCNRYATFQEAVAASGLRL